MSRRNYSIFTLRFDKYDKEKRRERLPDKNTGLNLHRVPAPPYFSKYPDSDVSQDSTWEQHCHRPHPLDWFGTPCSEMAVVQQCTSSFDHHRQEAWSRERTPCEVWLTVPWQLCLHLGMLPLEKYWPMKSWRKFRKNTTSTLTFQKNMPSQAEVHRS